MDVNTIAVIIGIVWALYGMFLEWPRFKARLRESENTLITVFGILFNIVMFGSLVLILTPSTSPEVTRIAFICFVVTAGSMFLFSIYSTIEEHGWAIVRDTIVLGVPSIVVIAIVLKLIDFLRDR